MKNTDIDFLLNVAKLAATRSKAVRLKVGGVVTSSVGDIIAFAYNGTPHNFDNTCERRVYEPLEIISTSDMYPLTDVIGNYRLETKENVIHCEANLIAHAARRGISIDGGMVFLTHSPCIHCASLMWQAGIKEVYFLEEFRTHNEVYDQFSTFLEFIHWRQQ